MSEEATDLGQEPAASEGESSASTELGGGESEPKTYDQKYVSSLREEAASWRTKYQPWNEAAEKYSSEEQEIWRNIMVAAATDPKKGAQLLRDLSNEWDPQEETMSTEGGDSGEEYLTRGDFEKEYSARQQQAEREAERRRIADEARSLGYNADPSDDSYQALLHAAYHHTQGDLRKAHEHLEQKMQGIIDQYVEDRRKDAETSPAGPPAELAKGVLSERGEAPKTFEDARAAMRAMMQGTAGV